MEEKEAPLSRMVITADEKKEKKKSNNVERVKK